MPKFTIIAFITALLSFAQLSWAEEEGEEASKPEAKYVELSPAFVTNFGQGSAKLKFVKADVTLRVLGDESAQIVESNIPMVRHEIVMLLSSQSAEQMTQADTQENLRLEAIKRINAIMEEETGAARVDDLLFTTFVVQG